MNFPTESAASIPSRELQTHDAVLGGAWIAFDLRRVPDEAMVDVRQLSIRPRAGDLVAATVTEIGHHKHLQLRGGRRGQLEPGRRIVVAYGNRYATNQFEAYVPNDLSACDLVAAGGVAANCVSRASRIGKPTRIQPIGLVCGPTGSVVNVADFRLAEAATAERPRPLTIAVLGSGMDAGKTTTGATLVRGLRAGGMRAAAVKVTGTAACNDYFSYLDAGAELVFDPIDAGMVSTFLEPAERIVAGLRLLLAHSSAAAVDAVVVEIADGLLQKETAELIATSTFREAIDSVVLAASDSMSALACATILRRIGLPLSAIAGLVSSSELLRMEASDATGLPVLDRDELARADIVQRILPRVAS